jgi:hypothetical protein
VALAAGLAVLVAAGGVTGYLLLRPRPPRSVAALTELLLDADQMSSTQQYLPIPADLAAAQPDVYGRARWGVERRFIDTAVVILLLQYDTPDLAQPAVAGERTSIRKQGCDEHVVPGRHDAFLCLDTKQPPLPNRPDPIIAAVGAKGTVLVLVRCADGTGPVLTMLVEQLDRLP